MHFDQKLFLWVNTPRGDVTINSSLRIWVMDFNTYENKAWVHALLLTAHHSCTAIRRRHVPATYSILICHFFMLKQVLLRVLKAKCVSVATTRHRTVPHPPPLSARWRPSHMQSIGSECENLIEFGTTMCTVHRFITNFHITMMQHTPLNASKQLRRTLHPPQDTRVYPKVSGLNR
jgi:hypothetical protein